MRRQNLLHFLWFTWFRPLILFLVIFLNRFILHGGIVFYSTEKESKTKGAATDRKEWKIIKEDVSLFQMSL